MGQFMIEFDGGTLLDLLPNYGRRVVRWISPGSVVNVRAEAVSEGEAVMSVRTSQLNIANPFRCDCYRKKIAIVTETCLYQYHPFRSENDPAYWLMGSSLWLALASRSIPLRSR
jgi:hypothetical protein